MGLIGHLLRKVECLPSFAGLLDQLTSGRQTIELSGLRGSAKSFLAALLHGHYELPLVLVTAGNQEAEQAARDFLYFHSQLHPDCDCGGPVVFPAHDADPYRGFSPHPTVSQQRAFALWQLSRANTLFVSLPATALLSRLPHPTGLSGEGQEISKGDWIAPDELIAKLVAGGYAQEDPVTEEGEYARRGGIVDVYPPGAEFPYRLEFFGDEVVSLRTYDTETQRSIKEVRSAVFTPLRETPINADRLLLWAIAAEEKWRSSPYFSRLEPMLQQARQGEAFSAVEFNLPLVSPLESSFFDYASKAVFLLDEPESLLTESKAWEERMHRRYQEVGGEEAPILPPGDLFWSAEQVSEWLGRRTCLLLRELGGLESSLKEAELHFGTQPVRKYQGMIREFIGDAEAAYREGETLILLSSSLGRAERVQELLLESDIPVRLSNPAHGADQEIRPEGPAEAGPAGPARIPVTLGVGELSCGFRLPEPALTLLSSQEIFGDNELQLHRRPRRHAARGTAFFSDFRDLKVGDHVVHVDHGIGQFRGLVQMGLGDQVRDFVLLYYKNEARLYLPVDRLDLIEKYSSVGGAAPHLDQLGGTSWQKTKTRIKKSMRDMAEELLKLYAQRNLVDGYRFTADGPWHREFEEAFEFDETDDQLSAILDVRADMESNKPMDRLLCGDVGYGKTEVAMRAAFKAVMDGKQVCVLAPTTILAFQHLTTFSNRLKTFPVRVDMLSRFRTPKEQKRVVAEVELGQVDILIGTHRLLSRDVKFKDLGLVIIDEEQRFGVSHKEKLKQLKTKVDVLTLSATPIPRTLHMSMMGIRDMSVIETPPKDRLSIQTAVVRFSPEVIKAAIEMELARGGQVYFVHNRIESIYSVAAMIQRLCPQARVVVGHGQMSEDQLEEVMLKFVKYEADILVATTIIENGLDIPLVNTIIINRADRYGLAQLYQLRGRVGRSNRRAYAFLLVPSEDSLSDVARRRLAAIREFSDLGAGFRIAALDLEIRGAGNLLGGEQHGHIDAVGFDLYCQLLEQAVQEIKGETPVQESAAAVNLNLDIRIPEEYVGETSQRLRLYKRIASAKDAEQLAALHEEIVDRHGPFPEQLVNLFAYAELRVLATGLGVETIDRKAGRILIKFSDRSPVDPSRLLALIRKQPGVSFSPGGVLAVEEDARDGQKTLDQVRMLLKKIG